MLTARAVLTAAAALLMACGCARHNPRLDSFSMDEGYRFRYETPPGKPEPPANSEDLFVILTFSGGGTRAAALSYGVIEKLAATEIAWPEGQPKSLLDEVDVISAVSGGSFTAASFALDGNKILGDGPEAATFRERVLYNKFQWKILARALFNPAYWLRLPLRGMDRDVLAFEYYDRHLFDGRTYGDLLGEDGRRRPNVPFVIINATDMLLGTPFEFTQDRFDYLYSDLSEVPIARAVAASAAYPGVSAPLTLTNYANPEEYEEPAWIQEAIDGGWTKDSERYIRACKLRTYVHENDRNEYVYLLDGGVSDNLGLRGVIDALSTSDSPWSLPEKIGKVVVITVNAKTGGIREPHKRANAPALWKVARALIRIDETSFDTIQMWKKTMQLLEAREEARLPEDPHKRVKYYFIEVAFDGLDDATEREYYNGMGTNFGLRDKKVDDLREVAGVLLDSHPVFEELRDGLRAGRRN